MNDRGRSGPRAEPPGGAARARVVIFDDQTDDQPDVPIDVARWQRLAEQVLDAEGIGAGAELSVSYVTEERMAELNQQFMGEAAPTDVLSFPIDRCVRGGDAPTLLGDVVICPAVAARNAPHHAGELDDELALLLVHGILHVLGHDHAEPTEASRMHTRERALLTRFHGPVAAGTEIPAASVGSSTPAGHRPSRDPRGA